MSTSPKYTLILFDADGTLFNYDEGEKYALKRAMENYGHPYSEALRDKYRIINRKQWDLYEQGLHTKEDMQKGRFRELFQEVGIDCPDPWQFNLDYLDLLGDGVFMIDHAETVCKALYEEGVLLAVATNGILRTQRRRLEGSPLKPYFPYLFASEEIGYAKPDQRYFNTALDIADPQREKKVLMVGDSLTADIAGGNRMGFDTCWFNEQGLANDSGESPTYEIHNLLQVLDIVLK